MKIETFDNFLEVIYLGKEMFAVGNCTVPSHGMLKEGPDSLPITRYIQYKVVISLLKFIIAQHGNDEFFFFLFLYLFPG